VEIFFTAVFTLELLFNLFGSWYTEFVNDGWSVFDAIVIVISILGLIPSVDIPGLNIMRLVKVFKIVRLFRKLTALRILINAITQSLVPVTYAFAILLLVSSLYSIIATQLFSVCDSSKFDCQGILDHDCDGYGDSVISINDNVVQRLCKSQHFGTFTLALFTFFQMSTGDGWSDVTRGLMRLQLDGFKAGLVAMFFVSYMLIVGTVLVQIVVAVLLDEFINTVAKEKEEMKAAQKAAENAHKSPIPGPVDPLLETFLDYTTMGDLNNKIDFCFEKLDLSENGAVSLEEFNEGLKRMLPSDIKLKLTDVNWNDITENGKLCIKEGDQAGEINREQFRTLILQQFTLYTRRRVVTSMDKEMNEQAFDTLFSLKTVLSSVEAMSQDVTSVKQQVMFQRSSRHGNPLPLTPPTDEPNCDETNFSRTSSRHTSGKLPDQAPPWVAEDVGHDMAEELDATMKKKLDGDFVSRPALCQQASILPFERTRVQRVMQLPPVPALPGRAELARKSMEAAGVPRDFHDGLISAGLDLETLQLLVKDQMVHSHTVLKEAGVTEIGDRVRIVSAIRAGLSGSRAFSNPLGGIVFVEPGLPADTSVPLRQFNKPVSLRMEASQPEVGSTISRPQAPNPPQSRGTCKYCQLAVTLAQDRGRNEDGAYFHMSCLPVPFIETPPTTGGGDKTVQKSTAQPVSLKMETVRETSSQPEVQALQKLHYGQTPQGYEPPPPGWAQRLLELQDLVADMSYLSASAPDSVAPSPPARRDSRVAAPETKPGNWTSRSAARSAASITSHETPNALAAVLPQGYGPPPPGYGAYGYCSGTG
jgi:hypothetical protein